MRNLILLAVPGGGKGTLAAKLVDEYGYVHISTGDLLRERRKTEDEIGKIVAEAQDTGGLVPSDIVYKIFEERVSQSDCDNGYILDGFPRNLEQAYEYENILKRTNRNLGIVLSLDVPKEILGKRITGRRICRECGANHNIYSPDMLPRIDGICNKCGGELYHREDDNLETLNSRINTYLEKTQPLMDYYKEKGVLYTLDSSDHVKIFNDFNELMSKLGE